MANTKLVTIHPVQPNIICSAYTRNTGVSIGIVKPFILERVHIAFTREPRTPRLEVGLVRRGGERAAAEHVILHGHAVLVLRRRHEACLVVEALEIEGAMLLL